MPSRAYKTWLANLHAKRARRAAHKAAKSARATKRSQRRSEYLAALAVMVGRGRQREMWRAA